MWKTARISAREVRHWPWKSDTRSQHSKERWSHYNGSEFPEQGDRRVPQKLQREGERKTIWGKNRRPLDEGGAKTLVILAFLYLLKFFGGRKAPRINSRQGRELKSRRNPRGFPKLENTREGRCVTIQRKRLLEARLLVRWAAWTSVKTDLKASPPSRWGTDIPGPIICLCASQHQILAKSAFQKAKKRVREGFLKKVCSKPSWVRYSQI